MISRSIDFSESAQSGAASVALVVGVGPKFGTGHQIRMLELRERLERVGISVVWLEQTALANAEVLEKLISTEAVRGIVLDARDIDPTPFATPRRPVLALDNRHAMRALLEAGLSANGSPGDAEKFRRVEFYDTIPHPQADLARTLDQALIRGDVLQLREKKTRPQPRNIFVYSGDFLVPALDRILARMVAAGWSVHRCGTHAPEEAITRNLKQLEFRWSPRLERDAYCAELTRSEFVGTYFGMTLLEAWYLQRTPFLFSVASEVHNELGLYLNRNAGVPFIDAEIMFPEARHADCAAETLREKIEAASHSVRRDVAPGGQGFDRLVARVRELIYSAGASSADTV